MRSRIAKWLLPTRGRPITYLQTQNAEMANRALGAVLPRIQLSPVLVARTSVKQRLAGHGLPHIPAWFSFPPLCVRWRYRSGSFSGAQPRISSSLHRDPHSIEMLFAAEAELP